MKCSLQCLAYSEHYLSVGYENKYKAMENYLKLSVKICGGYRMGIQ